MKSSGTRRRGMGERYRVRDTRLNQGTAAVAEFQKILHHSGLVWNCWTGALAHLGVARANALVAKNSQGADADAARVRALAANKDFLALWQDAGADIPIYRQAEAEYSKLQQPGLVSDSKADLASHLAGAGQMYGPPLCCNRR